MVELWTLTPQHPPGLTLSSVIGLLDAVRIATCRFVVDGDTGRRLESSDCDQRPTLAPHVYGRLVVALLNGTVSASGWRAPWRLQDIGIGETAMSRLAL